MSNQILDDGRTIFIHVFQLVSEDGPVEAGQHHTASPSELVVLALTSPDCQHYEV